MDYSKLSDDEIASKVLISQGYKLIDDGYGYSIYISDSGRKDIGPKSSKQFLFDPCNNAADSWPIVVANRIGLSPSVDVWHAYSPEEDYLFSGENPLRAAMIVYLMMQDGD